MKTVTVIGAGVAGMAFVESMRKLGSDMPIAILDRKMSSVAKHNFLAAPLAQVSVDIKSWARKYSVEVVCGTVERVNCRRRKIYFKEGGSRDFEELVVASGLASVKITMRGGHQEGCFYLSQIDPQKIKNLLKLNDEVTIFVTTMLGIRLARSLRTLGKTVRIVGDGWTFFGERISEVEKKFREQGVFVYNPAKVEEVIGEKVVRAVKISPLKVFSSQLVFFDSGFVPCRGFIDDEVVVNDYFFSNVEGVYFLGDVSRDNIATEKFFLYNYDETIIQAGLLAQFIAGGVRPIFQQKQKDAVEVINDFLAQQDVVAQERN